MERDFINGLMENIIKENLKMIKKMDMELMYGLMEKNMKVNFQKVYNMAKD